MKLSLIPDLIVEAEKKLQAGTKVKVGHESKTGIEDDIPQRYRGRAGAILKFVVQYDGEPPLYAVKMPNRKRPIHLYTDEFEVIQ